MSYMTDLTSYMTVLSKTKESFLVTLLRHQVISRFKRMFWSTLPWFELLTLTEDPNRLGTGINVTEKGKGGRKQHRVLTGQYQGAVVTISHSDVEHNSGGTAVLTGYLAYGNKSPIQK